VLASLPTAFGGKPTLPSFSVFPEHHRLFYLFYQVEIRYRQLPSQNKPSPTGAATFHLPHNYGNHMVDRLSRRDGSIGSVGVVLGPTAQVKLGTVPPDRGRQAADSSAPAGCLDQR
jgi:hypothetical protein